jgi:hypothetical protein
MLAKVPDVNRRAGGANSFFGFILDAMHHSTGKEPYSNAADTKLSP